MVGTIISLILCAMAAILYAISVHLIHKYKRIDLINLVMVGLSFILQVYGLSLLGAFAKEGRTHRFIDTLGLPVHNINSTIIIALAIINLIWIIVLALQDKDLKQAKYLKYSRVLFIIWFIFYLYALVINLV